MAADAEPRASSEERITYCRICEPLCGLRVTVEGGEVRKIRPDADHPLSAGFACPKGIAMADVQNDPDRVLHPLRRNRDGEFERVSWDAALDEIGTRLRRVIDTHGGDSVAWYMGNPAAFSYSHPLWVKGFLDGVGSPHWYTASSQDVSNRFAASNFLYGSSYVVPIPDLARTDLLMIVGGNPLVSHGSVMSAPRIKDQLNAIVERGGRVIVVDPRRSETARAFEHVAVTPDSDAWLLLSLLHVIFDEGLADIEAIARQASGAQSLRALAAKHPPEATEGRTGVPAEDVRRLARDIAGAEHAAIYGRTGSCLGRNGTLVAFLLDAVCLLTGNLDREGGAMFGDPPIRFDEVVERIGVGTYGKVRSRVGGFPEVLGALPAALMAKEIRTPGKGQIRAMLISAGNPVLSVPNGDELSEAMRELDLLVSIDLYRTETNREADFILPATTFLEREDFPLPFLALYTTPFVQWTDPVVDPAGEARQEWEIIDAIAGRIGVVASSSAFARLLGRVGIKLSPRSLVDLLLRTGPKGDLFGLRRGGLSLKKLHRNPSGIVLAEFLEPGVLEGKIRNPGKRVRLDAPEVLADAERLAARNGDDSEYPMRLIGLRELRSHNSWMHNARLLMRGGREQFARVNPRDAEAHGIEDGELCRISSPHGTIELPAKVTDEIVAGTIAVPHGWGHQTGGWSVAREAGGANVNALSSSDPEELEKLAGMAHLNGISVRIEPVRGGGNGSPQGTEREVPVTRAAPAAR